MKKIYEVSVSMKIHAESAQEALAVVENCSSAAVEVEEVSLKRTVNEEVRDRECVDVLAVPGGETATAPASLARNLVSLWERDDEKLKEYLAGTGLKGGTVTDLIGEAYRIRTADLERLARLINVSPSALVTEGSCGRTYVTGYPDSDITLTEVLAVNVIDYRKMANLSTGELEQRCGVTSVVRNLEDGICASVGLYQVDRIAQALGVHAADLLAYKSEPKTRIAPATAVEKHDVSETLTQPGLKDPEPRIAPSEPVQAPVPEKIRNAAPEIPAEILSADEILGRNISRIRSWWGQTQREFAQRADMSQWVISQLENSKHGTSLGKLDAIARATDVCPSILLTQDVPRTVFASSEHIYPKDYDILTVLAQNVNRARSAEILSMAALAKRAGISSTQIWNMERGNGNVQLATLDKVAKAVHVPVAWLLEVH